MRTLLVLGVVAAALTAGCNDPAVPDRECLNCYYSFADTFPPDTYVFHWPANRLPVRFWADPRPPTPFLVRNAIATWEAQFLYGEFRGVLVADSNQADVVVTWQGTVPADVPPDTAGAVNACDGSTTSPELFSDSSTNVVQIALDVRSGYTPAQLAACVRRLAIHEIGHSLGLVRHSPYPLDIMNAFPAVNVPSAEDRRTIEVLYHTPATIVPPPRP
jgi:predicted Zn-dependent protease